MRSFADRLNIILEGYTDEIWDILHIQHGIDPYDASELIKKNREAIEQDRLLDVPPENVVVSLLKVNERNQERQKMADDRRDVEQNYKLTDDIKSGKRPGPPINPPGPGDMEELERILAGIPL